MLRFKLSLIIIFAIQFNHRLTYKWTFKLTHSVINSVIKLTIQWQEQVVYNKLQYKMYLIFLYSANNENFKDGALLFYICMSKWNSNLTRTFSVPVWKPVFTLVSAPIIKRCADII